MAVPPKFASLFLALLLCLVAAKGASETENSKYGWLYPRAASLELSNRKVLHGVDGKRVVFKSGVQGKPTTADGGSLAEWGLRKVPAGPDPLHHNGGSPKKPRPQIHD